MKAAYKKKDGSVAIVEVAKGFYDSIGNDVNVAKAVIPEGAIGAVLVGDVPEDRGFRESWELVGGKVQVSLKRAKEQHLARIREIRDTQWLDFDKKYMLAERDGGDLAALKEERQKRQDATKVDLKACKTLKDIKSVMPEVLKWV